MADDKFESVVQNQFAEAMELNKFTGSPIDRLDSYSLQLVSPNRYALRMGNDVVRNRDNSPVIIDFTQPMTTAKPK
jgi:transglutaminase-like putative cysteine protease